MARQIGAFAKDDGRQKLYDSGLTDKEIGKKLYLHETSVFGWRTRRGLPANGGTGRGGLRINNKRHEKQWGGHNVYNKRPWTPKSIPLHEEQERLKCHAEGLTDSQAAVRCGIHHSTYHGWRKARGLSLNGDETKRGRAKKPEHKRSVLNAEDVVNYHRNDNTPRETSNKIILKVDINPVLDLPEPKMKLADSPRGSYAGVVIGSQWDRNRELIVTARQDTYANTVKRLVRNG